MAKGGIHYFISIDGSKKFMIDEPNHVKRMQENPEYREITKTKWLGGKKNGGNNSTGNNV
jgi:hypothetical protein